MVGHGRRRLNILRTSLPDDVGNPSLTSPSGGKPSSIALALVARLRKSSNLIRRTEHRPTRDARRASTLAAPTHG